MLSLLQLSFPFSPGVVFAWRKIHIGVHYTEYILKMETSSLLFWGKFGTNGSRGRSRQGLVDQLLIALDHLLETDQIHRRGQPCVRTSVHYTTQYGGINTMWCEPCSGGPVMGVLWRNQTPLGGKYITFPRTRASPLCHVCVCILLIVHSQLSSANQAFHSSQP